jgi:L-alanine-DL-glutamate epimerase-like enolase superfamily enzyme
MGRTSYDERVRVTLLTGRSRLLQPVTASGQYHQERDHLFVGVEDEEITGWGEVAPQPTTWNRDPGVTEVAECAREEIAPRLLRLRATLAELPTPGRLSGIMAGRAPERFATSAFDSALVDWWLRRRGESLDERYPVRFPTRSLRSAPDVWRGEESADRWRVKVGGHRRDDGWWEQLVERGGDVILDFNAGAREVDHVLNVLADAQRWVNVVAIEQPFAVGNLADVAHLRQRVDVTLSLDEGVRTNTDVRLAARHGVGMVCLKAARVGGWSLVDSLTHQARELGVDSYIGGFFESPLGRSLARSVARSLTPLPSDVAEVPLDTESLVEPVEGGVGWRPRSDLTVLYDGSDKEF